MENSFFEYRDKTGFDSGSDSEIIDESIIESVTYSSKKKNHTVFVAESDESTSNEESMNEVTTTGKVSTSACLHSRVTEAHVACSSDDDGSRRGIIKRHSASQNVVVTTSDEDDADELSPELIPKRRPLPQKKSMDFKSPIIQRTKKRMLFVDYDSDNSIVLEYNKNKKLTCLKDTPLKIESDIRKPTNTNQSMDYDEESCDSDDDDKQNNDECEDDDSDIVCNNKNRRKFKKLGIESDSSGDELDDPSQHDEKAENRTKKDYKDRSNHDESKQEEKPANDVSEGLGTEDDDEELDEDMMVMSRATRMSIMGVIPKDNDSDDSDFIQSDSSNRRSGSVTGSLEDLPGVSIRESQQKPNESDDELPEVSIHKTPDKTVQSHDNDIHKIPTSNSPEYVGSDDELPEVSIHKSPEKTLESDDELPEVTIPNTPGKTVDSDNDDSRISCSPFSSPLNDITNKVNSLRKNPLDELKTTPKVETDVRVKDFLDLTVTSPPVKPKDLKNVGVIDLSHLDHGYPKSAALDRSASVLTKKKAVFEDDDITIIESKPEIIALSSDDEDEPNVAKKTSKVKNSPRSKTKGIDEPKIEQGTMKQYLVPPSYPNQVKYVKKHVRENELDALERMREDLRNVQHLVESMELETLPDKGSRLLERHRALEREVRRQADKVANMVVEPDEPSAEDIARDGFNKGLSWEDIQKASNAVQPRMFGKQAMATHMAERNLMLESLRFLHDSLKSRPSESTVAAAPRLLQTTLMPHQLHALAWLQWRETQRPSGGILADDMGLGKTITMISLVAAEKQGTIDHEDDEDESTVKGKLSRGGTLVVCPASLIQQWAGEVGKHCAARALAVCLHHGQARAQAPHRLANYDIVVTTYNILQRDNEKNGILMRIQWRRVILDEAHIVRNHKSATSGAVSALRGARRWCLTGTPVQNKDLDLFALLKFLRCSPFNDIQMWKKWIDNKSLGGQERLNTIMQCILLRRTKVQLQQKGQLDSLPSKTQHLTPVTLTKDEMNVYQKVLVLSKTLFAQFLHQRAEKNADSVGFRMSGKNTEYDKMHKKMIALQGVKPVKSHEILVLLLRLRQVCCHCGLIASMLDESAADVQEEAASSDLLRELDKLSLEDQDRRKSNNPEEEEVGSEETAKADEAIRAVLMPNNPVFQLKRASSKIAAVMRCLHEQVFANKGEKAVVVSQWTSVLRLVEQELSKERVRSVTLSGNVPVPARPQLINQLNDPNSDVKVMLLSLCAGGVGINLCGANHLLLLDPHWNPQLEEQAQDRIYRVGQSKDVHIYRFVCSDTVEQTIRKLQEKKLELAENVLTGARKTTTSTLSIEDLKMLFNMGS